jgi:hypothetical protein
MEQEKTCNGFANYETWVVSLWMSNDQGSYEFFRELARRIRDCDNMVTAHLSKEENDAVALADALREEFEVGSPTRGESTVYADLMAAALCEVDWYEIAENLLNDIADGKEES